MPTPSWTWRLAEHAYQLDPSGHHALTWPSACRAATTANITIPTALNNADVLDGVTLATGDRVLVKDQSTASQNGIYIVGASPARAEDYATSGQIVGSIVVVSEGTTNADKAWLCTTNAPITVGTTGLVYTAFGTGGGGGGSLTIELLDGSGSVTGVATLRADQFTDNGGGDVSLFPQITGSGLGTIGFNSTILALGSPDGNSGINVANSGNVGIFADHTPGTGNGIDLYVGTHEPSVSFREQSSTRLQVVLNGGAGYNAEIADDSASNGTLLGRFAHLDDGGAASYPSLGMARRFSSAPTAQFEGEHYYDTTTHKEYVWNGSSWQALW